MTKNHKHHIRKEGGESLYFKWGEMPSRTKRELTLCLGVVVHYPMSLLHNF